jgi:transcriptional regulator with XRE-family HTH domain
MVRLSNHRTAAEVRASDMHDPAYRREYERTRLANDVAIKVLQHRLAHGLSQTELAALLNMRQPNIARLEAGEHAPTIETHSRLADVLKLDFSVDVKPGVLRLRRPSQANRPRATVTSASRHAKPRKPAGLPGGARIVAVSASADAADNRKALEPSSNKASAASSGRTK